MLWMTFLLRIYFSLYIIIFIVFFIGFDFKQKWRNMQFRQCCEHNNYFARFPAFTVCIVCVIPFMLLTRKIVDNCCWIPSVESMLANNKSNICTSPFYLGSGLLKDSRVSSLKKKWDRLSRPRVLSDTSDISSCRIFLTLLEPSDFCLDCEIFFLGSCDLFETATSADSVVCFVSPSSSSIVLKNALSEPQANIAEVRLWIRLLPCSLLSRRYSKWADGISGRTPHLTKEKKVRSNTPIFAGASHVALFIHITRISWYFAVNAYFI